MNQHKLTNAECCDEYNNPLDYSSYEYHSPIKKTDNEYRINQAPFYLNLFI